MDKNTVAHMVQWFKTMGTNEYIRHVKNDGWLPCDRRFWQRNYYERIIRTESSLNRIRRYIQHNLLSWENDKENPSRQAPSQ
jgi:REP element-mobilizing transposase RayT